MSDKQQENIYQPPKNNPRPELKVTNPLKAASEIFYKPKDVFDALAVRDNWSWIPFLLLIVILFIPPYLYFGIVNFDWYLDVAILPSLADLPPAAQRSTLAFYSPGQMQLTTGISIILISVIVHTIIAFYYAMATKNDSKSVQGFTDWYGAMWWFAMPSLVNALLALVLLMFQDAGSEINFAITVPLSLAYLLGVDMTSSWFNFLSTVRLDTIWTIYLGVLCLMSWTNFNRNKAIVVASIPTVLFLGLSLLITSI